MFMLLRDLFFFVSYLGGKYPVVVEFAPFQGVPKKTRRRKDIKASTIEKGAGAFSLVQYSLKEKIVLRNTH